MFTFLFWLQLREIRNYNMHQKNEEGRGGTGKNNTGAKRSSHRPQGPKGREKTLETRLEKQSQKIIQREDPGNDVDTEHV